MKQQSFYSETELYKGCLEKNPNIQKAVYNHYSSKMFALCLRYIKERAAAEDVLIIGFMKVFDRIHQFKGSGSFGGWIRRIMVNECLMYLEKEKNLYNEIGIDAVLPAPVYHQPSDELAVEDIMKLINSLPMGYRTVFNLYAIEGYSHQEIAQKLHISENTSKSQLSRARTHLQKMLNLKSGYKNRELAC
ncbi:RNA polymerase sigma factor [Cecembia calidifontis]|jgi:RNA polymerase sigma-70 factor (ECF subfamily)|uniref:RNA polymerase sigma-70 factor (ECF subfamily) n=1 Tax=Cecembia calidifontis TaxID=1187080 RepID=A0A4Q7PCQ0_9BACT|nr:sigma-70 family RNA polymerase sigma factor [Cecembia calidifontis]RZS97837.1 RNA polymerase sigma-70 factor (ECF subfamily) [Cecembia calidifontis]